VAGITSYDRILMPKILTKQRTRSFIPKMTVIIAKYIISKIDTFIEISEN
jgi:hypothetical protein